MSKAVTTQIDSYSKLLKYLETHNGRDKIVRLFQYGGRFLAWYMINNGKADQAKKFQTLEESSSLARKVFRLLKSLSYLQAMMKSYSEEPDPIVKLTTVVQNFSLAAWLFFDHIIWSAKIGLFKADVPSHAKKANIFWLIAMVCGIVKSCYLIQQTQKLLTTVKPEVQDSLRKAQTDYGLELVRNLLDLTIPTTGLSKQAAAVIPSGVVGLCGSLTSIIGIYQVWSKTK